MQLIKPDNHAIFQHPKSKKISRLKSHVLIENDNIVHLLILTTLQHVWISEFFKIFKKVLHQWAARSADPPIALQKTQNLIRVGEQPIARTFWTKLKNNSQKLWEKREHGELNVQFMRPDDENKLRWNAEEYLYVSRWNNNLTENNTSNNPCRVKEHVNPGVVSRVFAQGQMLADKYNWCNTTMIQRWPNNNTTTASQGLINDFQPHWQMRWLAARRHWITEFRGINLS